MENIVMRILSKRQLKELVLFGQRRLDANHIRAGIARSAPLLTGRDYAICDDEIRTQDAGPIQ
jgi:hypothetical protein